MLSSTDWHRRFKQQARWTEQIRRYLFNKIELSQSQRILEVGCGTGAIFSSLRDYTQAAVYGIDLDQERVVLASKTFPSAILSVANGLKLPFADKTFDVCLCHYYLLWVKDPDVALTEMVRVTRPGGFILALAEPDYGGRIDFPTQLEEIGRAQSEALAQQGADPKLGRRLAGLLTDAGLGDIQTGVLGGQWDGSCDEKEWKEEWEIIGFDLSGTYPPGHLETLRSLDWAARQHGERVLFVPTFYAAGRIKD